MAAKEMLQVRVFITERGNVCIAQDNDEEQREELIIIHPDQLDILIKWLNETKEEIQKEGP
ncbi:MAG: hypothetical protein HGA78_01245 [Nitrospirales bacterium]|nr:hypothetical protein [Nitrospirales bacterium]